MTTEQGKKNSILPRDLVEIIPSQLAMIASWEGDLESLISTGVLDKRSYPLVMAHRVLEGWPEENCFAHAYHVPRELLSRSGESVAMHGNDTATTLHFTKGRESVQSMMRVLTRTLVGQYQNIDIYSQVFPIDKLSEAEMSMFTELMVYLQQTGHSVMGRVVIPEIAHYSFPRYGGQRIRVKI
jgi:hypothetical protein